MKAVYAPKDVEKRKVRKGLDYEYLAGKGRKNNPLGDIVEKLQALEAGAVGNALNKSKGGKRSQSSNIVPKIPQPPTAHQQLEVRQMHQNIFTVMEQKLFKNMTAEEKQDEIKGIYRERRRRLKAQAQGKNFIDLNTKRLLQSRRDEQELKYRQMAMQHEMLKQRARDLRDYRETAETQRREFLFERGELIKVIKRVVNGAFNEQYQINMFYRDWLTVRAFFEVLTSLREEIDKRRQRRELEERALGTFVLFAIRGRTMLSGEGGTFKERNILHSVM